MQKRIGCLALALWLILMLVPAAVLASGSTYVVVGSSGLCGSHWDMANPDNEMTDNGDGTYVKVFTDVDVYDFFQLKVVEIPEGGDPIWHGGANGSSITFIVNTACDVTVNFEAATNTIMVSGEGVEMVTFDVKYITAVGNGDTREGKWLNGSIWNQNASENRMTELSTGVYEITYAQIAPIESCLVKFAANGSWNDFWGGAFAGSGVETAAEYEGDNIKFTAPYASNDITLRLNLSNYNHATKSGATFTVTIVEHHEEHSFTDAWEKDATYHWHRCQFGGCTEIRDQATHTMKPATCVSKAICTYCDYETGDYDSSNHALQRVPYKPATVTEDGNIEHWRCARCGGYFSDETGKNEIPAISIILSKLAPEIIEGRGQSVTAGEKKALTFRSNAAFSDFLGVELDGATLAAADYTAKEGSTVVTLKAECVAALSVGEHTIGVVSDGGTAACTFTVRAAQAETGPDIPDSDVLDHVPKTGDSARLSLWVALLLVSVCGLLGAAALAKRKNRVG